MSKDPRQRVFVTRATGQFLVRVERTIPNPEGKPWEDEAKQILDARLDDWKVAEGDPLSIVIAAHSTFEFDIECEQAVTEEELVSSFKRAHTFRAEEAEDHLNFVEQELDNIEASYAHETLKKVSIDDLLAELRRRGRNPKI